MAMATIATLPRLSSAALSSLILSQSPTSNPSLAIIDVRDDDHIGGHIKGSSHIPSSTLDFKIPELVRKLQDKDTVVFHCALSQQRGPSAALRYLRERERLLGTKPITENVIAEAMKKSANEAQKLDDKDGEWEVVPGSGSKKEQKVYVLDRGFVGWQETYGEDERLTEGYVKDLWKDGY